MTQQPRDIRAEAIWRGYREREETGTSSAIRGPISDLLRRVLSWAPRLGIIRAPGARREGISAIVRVSRGEEWVEPSICSIRDFADEIIVLAHDDDAETRTSIERCRKALADRLKVVDAAGIDFFQLSNLGARASSFRWVFRWDADFIARTTGEQSIHRLRNFLLGLDPRRFYHLHVAAVELDGDLFHQIPGRRVRYDPEVFTHNGACYVAVKKDVQRLESLRDAGPVQWRDFTMRYDTLDVPKYYRVVRWDTPCLFHLNVKSARSMLLRYFWLEWLGQDSPEYPTIEEFVRSRIGPELGTEDLTVAASRFVNQYVRHLSPCRESLVGEYPEELEPYLESPRYRVVYRDGEIVGRDDTLDP